MGTTKNRNFMDLREAVDIKKWWQKYTEEHSKKIFMMQITMLGVITHLKSDILESKV